MLIDHTGMTIKKSKSPINYKTEGGEGYDIWDRFVTLDGANVFHIGNICETCEFFFERLQSPPPQKKLQQVVGSLKEGVNNLGSEILDPIGQILPNGDYEILLKEIHPKLIELSGKEDYFFEEQMRTWDPREFDEIDEMPWNPKTSYYRASTLELENEECLFEFVIPFYENSHLDDDTLLEYSRVLSDGNKPTALALSFLDIKSPIQWEEDFKPEYKVHWCLAHYLIDGHHKVHAAFQTGRPLTLISFLNKRGGTASEDGITQVIKRLKNSNQVS